MEPAEVIDVAQEHGATPAQIRLAWALHQGPHLLVIPGAGDPAHLIENVAAANLELTPADLDRLGTVHRRAAITPG